MEEPIASLTRKRAQAVRPDGLRRQGAGPDGVRVLFRPFLYPHMWGFVGF